MKGYRVLVTGGAGFIGSHLVERLAASNEVVVLDLRPKAEAGNLAGVMDRIDYRHGDIRRDADAEAAVKGADVVFHLAALVSVPESVRDPEAFVETNVHGTLRVLRAARSAGVRRVVFTSSCAVYGAGKPPLREDAALDPLSPYAVTKAAGELWCRLHHDLGSEVVALRPFNVYGPRQSPEGAYAAAIPKFLDALAKGRAPEVYGDGDQTRDFIFVGDSVEAHVRAATAPAVSGEIINVGTGRPVSVNQLLEAIQGVLGTKTKARHLDPRSGDIRHSHADTGKAERLLGSRPATTLHDGLAATAKALRA